MKVITAAASLALVFVLTPNTASAQAFGAGAYYDTEVEELGLGANVVFHTGGVIDHSRVGIDFKYWLVDGGAYYTGNIDGHYLFFKGPQALSYGILGLNVSTFNFDNDFVDDIVDLGVNLGAGGELTLAQNIALYGEAKFLLSLGDIDSRIIAGGGVRIYLGGGGGGDLDLSDM